MNVAVWVLLTNVGYEGSNGGHVRGLFGYYFSGWGVVR